MTKNVTTTATPAETATEVAERIRGIQRRRQAEETARVERELRAAAAGQRVPLLRHQPGGRRRRGQPGAGRLPGGDRGDPAAAAGRGGRGLRLVAGGQLGPGDPVVRRWWDVGQEFYTTRPSHTAIWNHESYLNGTGLMGSHVRFRIGDVDDDDTVVLAWTNGYMRLFTMPFTGYLAVDMFLTSNHSKHFIDTDDEYGKSWCSVSAIQYATGQVFWLAALLGEDKEAADLFDAALEANRRLGAPPLVARTQLQVAHALLGTDAAHDRDRARTMLASATTTARRLAMAPLLRDIERLAATFSR